MEGEREREAMGSKKEGVEREVAPTQFWGTAVRGRSAQKDKKDLETRLNTVSLFLFFAEDFPKEMAEKRHFRFAAFTNLAGEKKYFFA